MDGTLRGDLRERQVNTIKSSQLFVVVGIVFHERDLCRQRRLAKIAATCSYLLSQTDTYHRSSPKGFTPSSPHTNQSYSPRPRDHVKQHRQIARREGRRGARQKSRRAPAHSTKRRKRITMTNLSTSKTRPHKNDHSLTPPNRTDLSKHGLRNLRRLSGMPSWRMSQGLSKRAYM
jgi:hypothetical protein